MRVCLFIAGCGAACAFLASSGRTVAATALTTEVAASGLSQPLFLTFAPGDSTRLYVVEKAGRIRVVRNDTLINRPILDITSRVRDLSNEQGLLGLAFHPQFAGNRIFYVNYSGEPDGGTVIARYRMSALNPDSAVADSEQVVLQVPQFATNHNGGMIAFGPHDHYLYIGMGDGGSSNDPGDRAQNPDSLLGKMLRLDVDVDSTYAVPPDNPFVIADTARHEIWAMGVRNPWRWSFDRETGDLWIADVGQGAREEVDWQSAGSAGGENYGWRLKEGTSCNLPPTNCDPGGVLDDPITQYGHTGGRCAITGGYVYRGCAIPDLVGTYFYGDYCTGEVWSVRYDGVSISDSTDRTGELGMADFNLVSFGEDAEGELYLVAMGQGTVYRIVPSGAADACGDCPVDLSGDLNQSGTITAADIIYAVNFVFKGGAAPLPITQAGDVDCSGAVTSADIIVLVQFVFKGGAVPCDVCSLL